MQNKTIEISGCKDCPMCNENDMSSGYSCRIAQYPNDYIKQANGKYIPETPEWCPLKQSDITFKFKKIKK